MNVYGTCRKCDTTTLEFDCSGDPGSTLTVEGLVFKHCSCPLMPEEIERARMHIVEEPEAYFGRAE